MRYPRFLNRMWAHMRSYSWRPCPICGRMFGSHEAADTMLHDSLPELAAFPVLKDGVQIGTQVVTIWRGTAACWRCNGEAGRRNEEILR